MKAEAKQDPKPPLSAEAREKPGIFSWVRDHIEAILVAYLFALIIRCFAIDVFQIPTGSMEPTLRGSPVQGGTGDRIMVMKFYPGLFGVDRYDVVTFRPPFNPARVYIKRIVGLPGDEWFIHDASGNLMVRRPGEAEFAVARKTERTQGGVWQAADASDPLSAREEFHRHWRRVEDAASDVRYTVDGGRLEIRGMTAEGTVDFENVREIVQRITPVDRRTVDDVALRASFTAEGSAGELHFEITNAYGTFRLEIRPDGGSAVVHSVGSGETRHPLAGVRFAAGKRHRVEFSVVDGLWRVRFDGKTAGEFAFATTYAEFERLRDPTRAPARGGGERQGPYLRFGSRGLAFVVSELAVVRDVHYGNMPNSVLPGRPEEALRIPDDRFLVLGDNQFNSEDSRAWRIMEIELADGRRIRYLKSDGNVRDEGGVRIIEADDTGTPRRIALEEIVRTEPPRADPFIRRTDILGKAFCVWWPVGDGSVRLIR